MHIDLRLHHQGNTLGKSYEALRLCNLDFIFHNPEPDPNGYALEQGQKPPPLGGGLCDLDPNWDVYHAGETLYLLVLTSIQV
jgi:hypothetical protein